MAANSEITATKQTAPDVSGKNQNKSK